MLSLGYALESSPGPLGLVFAVAATLLFVVCSGVWHGIILLVERRWRLASPLRMLAFLLPVIAAIGLLYLVGPPPQPVNKQPTAISSSGAFKASVSTRGGSWVVRITGKDGTEFKETTRFVSNLNVYWIWDAQERFWIYNSDGGSVHFWDRAGGSWKHIVWGTPRTKAAQTDAQPPRDLFPDSVKKLL